MSPIETCKAAAGRLSRRAGGFFKRFARARDGIAALEFAVISPILIALYFGVTELSDALTAGAKTTSVVATAADLVAQDTKVCNAEMTDIFSALDSIIFPYPTGTLHVVVSSLIDAGNGTVKVAWSDAHNGSPRTVNSIVPIPSGLVTTGGSVIFAEVTYYYSSPTGKLIYGSIPLQDKFYMRPRRVAQVARTSTTC